jgi:hypothetical protein
MNTEELNKGKGIIVNLLNSIFSSGDGYHISYDYDGTTFIIDFVSEGDKLPVITKRLIMETVYSNFRKASRYFPDVMYFWKNFDFVVKYNGKELKGDSINDAFISQPITDCFDSSLEKIQSNSVTFPTVFINVNSKMGEFFITTVNSKVMKSTIEPSDNYIYFFTYLVPDYLLLSNGKGESVKITAESLRDFHMNGGEDGEPYYETPEKILEALLRAIAFAQTEQYESKVSSEFYNCLRSAGFEGWGEGMYEDYYPLYEVIFYGISDMIITTYGIYGEAYSGDFETIEDLFNFLNRK